MSQILTKEIIQEINNELKNNPEVYDLDLTSYWSKAADVILHRNYKDSNKNSVVFGGYMTDNDVMKVLDSFCEEVKNES